MRYPAHDAQSAKKVSAGTSRRESLWRTRNFSKRLRETLLTAVPPNELFDGWAYHTSGRGTCLPRPIRSFPVQDDRPFPTFFCRVTSRTQCTARPESWSKRAEELAVGGFSVPWVSRANVCHGDCRRWPLAPFGQS